MTDGNELVNGRLGFQPLGNEYDGTTCVGQYTDGGLTKRELFAAMAMQGLLADSAISASYEEISESAVGHADALIAEINKETTK